MNTGSFSLNRRQFLATAGAAAGAAAMPLPLRASSGDSPKGGELLDYDGVGLAQLIRTGQVTAGELLEAAITRVEALDGQLNAMTTLAFERARGRVKTISPDTLFAGVPTLFKDLVDVGGVRRTSGSRMLLANVPRVSVAYVEAVEAAGLNLLGMTNTPEFASLALSDNLAFGPTRNPWSLEHSAGGSSGGSAAAVAAGYVPLAHGTDGGGSNRIPASCCGVLGMKPSRYRQLSGEPDGGHMFLRTHQCLSRTVRDSAVLFAATENPANQAGYPPVGTVSGPGKRRLRIAISVEDCFGSSPEASVREVWEKTAQLCESLGHEIEVVNNPLGGEALFAAVEGIMLADMPALLRSVEALTGRPAEEAGILTPATVAMGRYGARYTPEHHAAGIAWFRQLTEQFSQFFSRFDVWLTPVMPVETPRVGYVGPNSSGEELVDRNRRLLSYTALANGLGAPAMSVPLFHSSSSKLPIGSHFLAAPGADRTLYELAFELERARPWLGRWAPVSAKQAEVSYS